MTERCTYVADVLVTSEAVHYKLIGILLSLKKKRLAWAEGKTMACFKCGSKSNNQ
jgi:hypothetical protein